MDRCDVAVVGAGPAGCMAARYAARAGASTLLLEEHSAVGWPVQCAGLLGTEALAEAELPGGPYILQEVSGARIFSPGGSCLGFRAPSSRAFVIDRRLFDRALALEAVRAGAELHLRSGVRRMGRVEGGRLLALSDGSEIRARVVISAEGVRARLARQAGIAPPQRILSGAQFLLPFAVEDPERVEVHLGEAPGLFAWVIPVGDGQARIGLCAEDGALLRLEAFIRKERISERILGSAVEMNVGGLPLGPPSATYLDSLLAVGDAAGQVKPVSGGGIYPGLVCAKIAGCVAAACSLEGDCSAAKLSEYDRRWRALLGREIEVGMRVNLILTRMSDTDLDSVVGYLGGRQQILRTIEEHGDLDHPSRLLPRLLSQMDPGALGLARLLRHLLS